MTEFQALFLVLAVLYLLQCLVWVPADAVAFRPAWRRKWRLVRRGLQFAEGKSRGLFTSPLPPLAALIVCEPLACAVSPTGVAAAADPPRPKLGSPKPAPRQFRFDDAGKISVADKEVHFDGALLIRHGSSAAARQTAQWLERLRGMKEKQRPAALAAEFARRLDTAEIAARLEAWKDRSFSLRLACNSLFLLLFVIAPFHVWRQIIFHTWPLLLVYLLAHAAVITWLFRRLHSSLYPDEKEWRWTNAMLMAISPPAAARAMDVVLKDLLCNYDPAAVARVLCDDATQCAVASRTLRALRFPIAADAAAEFRLETEAWFREHFGQAFEKFLLANGMPSQELLGPPQRLSDQSVTYCPRCCSQFVVEEGTCSDCPGVMLLRFPPATGAAVM